MNLMCTRGWDSFQNYIPAVRFQFLLKYGALWFLLFDFCRNKHIFSLQWSMHEWGPLSFPLIWWYYMPYAHQLQQSEWADSWWEWRFPKVATPSLLAWAGLLFSELWCVFDILGNPHAPDECNFNECSQLDDYRLFSTCTDWTCLWLQIVMVAEPKFRLTSVWYRAPLFVFYSFLGAIQYRSCVTLECIGFRSVVSSGLL